MMQIFNPGFDAGMVNKLKTRALHKGYSLDGNQNYYLLTAEIIPDRAKGNKKY